MSLPRVAPPIRDFWRGLTTPGAGVVKGAAVILLVVLGVFSVVAVNFRRKIDAGEVDWRNVTKDYCRVSVLAMRGAARETDPSAKNLIFVGPSSLRCWLPPSDEVDALATAAAGTKMQVREMCAGGQSYATTAALIDRFGTDFNGWFVIGVARQTIGRTMAGRDVKDRTWQSRAVGFYSDILIQNSESLGYPQDPVTGWELWDHRIFYHQMKLGWKSNRVKVYNPYPRDTVKPSDAWVVDINPLDEGALKQHLVVIGQVVQRVREQHHARVALVETPWVDTYDATLRTSDWQRDETTYQQIMREWSQSHDVPWITTPASFAASANDFADPKHIGIAKLRREFLEAVARDLTAR